MWLRVNNPLKNDDSLYFGVFNSDPRIIGRTLERPKNPFFGSQISLKSFSERCCNNDINDSSSFDDISSFDV